MHPAPAARRAHGINDKHAIFGWTDDCVATQPSDPPVALAALDAVFVTAHHEAGRRIPATELHTLPRRPAGRDNVLRHGELITASSFPRRRAARPT